MIALLPVYQQGILIPVHRMDPYKIIYSGFVSKQIKLADTVLSLLDGGSLNSSLKSVSQTAPLPFPALSHSYVKECPANATAIQPSPLPFQAIILVISVISISTLKKWLTQGAKAL